MQLQEKIMVADTLAGINGELVRYAEMIAQSGFTASKKRRLLEVEEP